MKRESDFDSHDVFRSFDEFCELYQQLLKTFPALVLTQTPSLNKFKEAKTIAKRRQEIDQLIQDVLSLQPEISQVIICSTYLL